MGRPAGSKNGAKAEKEAAPKTNIDDVAECYVEYTDFMGQIARMRQKIATMLNRYENMGVHTKSVRACYRLANMDDAPEYVKEMLRTAAILKIIPAAEESDGQMTFLPGLKVAAPSAASQAKVEMQNAFWAGHDAGTGGSLLEACPHEPGSELYVTWEKGWKSGHDDWKAKPKNQNVETASGEKRPRGRPKKADRVDDRTQLERDEASYRGQNIDDVEPVTGTLQ